MARQRGRVHRAVVAAAATIAIGSITSQSHGQTIQRLLGVDVSDWQEENPTHTPIDWELAHRPTSQGGGGKDFVFMRATRGGTNGTFNKFNRTGTGSQRYDDYAFERNMSGAIAAGMYAAPYHFLRADIVTYTHPTTGVLTTHTATDEANHFLEMAGHYMRPGYLLPVMDLEAGNTQRTPDNLAAFAVEFGQRIYDQTGVWPMVYASTSYASDPQTSGNAAGYIRSIVAEKMPNLWLARWPNQANPNAIDVQNIDPTPAAGYPNAYGVWNPTYPNTPSPHPWKFWQYASTGKNIPGILGDANGNTDLNVAHGGHEFVKDYLVPALWTKPPGAAWATVSNCDTDAHPSGNGPAARLPGGNDTVVLDRVNEHVSVNINNGVPSIRKLYLKEMLTINNGGALSITYAPSPDSTPMSVHLSRSLNVQDGGSYSAHTTFVDPGANLSISAASMTLTTLRLSSGNTMIIGDAFDEAQSPTFAGFNGGTATITHNAAAGQPVPTIYLAGGSGGIKVADGPADIDLTVNVPIVNFGGGSGLTKYGPGTMALGAVNQGNAVVVQRGILLVTGNNQLGTGPVSTQQTVVTPGSAGSGYGGTLQLSNN